LLWYRVIWWEDNFDLLADVKRYCGVASGKAGVDIHIHGLDIALGFAYISGL
jgi:hypothetical protein